MRVYPYGKRTLLGIILLSLVGCVSVNVIPTALPLPEAPNLTFISQTGQICLSEADANQLGKYLDSINAFRSAWERLRAP